MISETQYQYISLCYLRIELITDVSVLIVQTCIMVVGICNGWLISGFKTWWY